MAFMEHVWIPTLSHFPLTKYLSHELDFEKEKDLGQEQWETKLKGCDCCHCTGEGLAPDNGPETICCIDEATYEDSTLLGRRSEVIPSEFLQKPWRFVHKSHVVAETATRLEDIWICQGLWIYRSEGPNHEPVKEIPLGNRQSTCHSQVEAWVRLPNWFTSPSWTSLCPAYST